MVQKVKKLKLVTKTENKTDHKYFNCYKLDEI